MLIEKDNFYTKKKHIDALFHFLERKKEEQFIEYITSIPKTDIDINTKDNYGNYLINYICLLNYPRCLEVILKFDCRLDIIDDAGHSIMYYPIRLNYTEIFNILIKTRSIGSCIIDIVDKHDKTPLFYAIDSKNYIFLQELITNGANSDHVNKDSYTPFLYSIKKRDYIATNLLFRNTNMLNIQNNMGYTPLHYLVYNKHNELIKKLLENGATQYLGEFSNGHTPIFYSIFKDYTDVSILLLNNTREKFNYDYQDYEGNTLFHVICSYEKFNNFDIYLENVTKNPKLFDFDQTNIDGDTVLHYILTYHDKIDIDIVKFFIKNTDLNIQNNEGVTPLHLISKYDLWEKYHEIISTKKLYPFIMNKDNKTVFDFIVLLSRKTVDDILVKSILNNIKQRELIEKCKIEDNECINEIKNAIYIKDPKIFGKYSSINIDTFQYVPFTTFTGSQIDQFFGFYYLKLKFKNLDIPMINSRKVGEKTKKLFDLLGLKIGMNKFFLDFEVKWVTQQLILPDHFETKIIDFFNNSTYDILIYPINIILTNGEHSNLLIIDKKKKEIYRFEPHGSIYLSNFNYNPDSFDNLLKKKIKNIMPDLTYITPNQFLPVIGFQSLDVNELDTNHNIGDPNGFCLLWCIWFSYYKTMYLDLDIKKLTKKLIKSIRMKNITYRNLIRNFSKEITDLRDIYLSKHNHDINDYLNNRINYETITDIINDCFQKIDN